MRDRQSSRRRPARSGNAIIEMSLVLMTLMVLCMGAVEYGQFLYVRQAFVAAARDAARQSILPTTSSMTPINNVVTSDLAQANVTYSTSSGWLTFQDVPSGSSTGTGTATTTPWTITSGDSVKVILSTTYSTIPNVLRPLSAIYSGAGIGASKQISSTCTMAVP